MDTTMERDVTVTYIVSAYAVPEGYYSTLTEAREHWRKLVESYGRSCCTIRKRWEETTTLVTEQHVQGGA